jgi:hypothetical protein
MNRGGRVPLPRCCSPRVAHGAGAGVDRRVAGELSVELREQRPATPEIVFRAGGGQGAVVNAWFGGGRFDKVLDATSSSDSRAGRSGAGLMFPK